MPAEAGPARDATTSRPCMQPHIICGPRGRTTTLDAHPQRQDRTRGVPGSDLLGEFPVLHRERHAPHFELRCASVKPETDTVRLRSPEPPARHSEPLSKFLDAPCAAQARAGWRRCDAISAHGDGAGPSGQKKTVSLRGAKRRSNPVPHPAVRRRAAMPPGVSQAWAGTLPAVAPRTCAPHRDYLFGPWSLPPKRRVAG